MNCVLTIRNVNKHGALIIVFAARCYQHRLRRRAVAGLCLLRSCNCVETAKDRAIVPMECE